MKIGDTKIVGDTKYEVVARFFGEYKYETFVATATNDKGTVHFTCGQAWWDKQEEKELAHA